MLLFFAAAGGAVAQDADPAPPRYDEALKLYQANRYTDSLDVIRSVFDNHRNSERLRTLAAMNYAGLGEFENGFAHMRYCLQANPRSLPCRVTQAALYRSAGNPAAAVQAAAAGIRAMGDRPELRMEIAGAYYSMGRYPEARQHLDKALQQAPNDFHAIYLDGLIFLREGKFENAEFRLRHAMNIKTKNRSDMAKLYINLGFALERQADAMAARGGEHATESKAVYKEASDFYRYALELESGNSLARGNLARVENKM